MGTMDNVTLCLRGGLIADVRTGTLRSGTVMISGDRIAAIVPAGTACESAPLSLDLSSRIIAPGYIEPHTHFILANPIEFARTLLPTGTTTAVVDALPLMMVARPDHLPAALEGLASLPLSLRWQIRLHAQSFSAEHRFTLERLRDLWRLPSVVAVGEVTRWPDVCDGDADLIAKIRAAQADHRRVEGHAPGASYQRLQMLAAAGFTSCHEAISAEEVRDRLRAGLYVMLRHSPIRPDLPQLAAVMDAELETSPRLMLTADGPTPAFIADHGYLDYLLEIALRSGLPPFTALRMATLNPAAYYGLHDRGEVAIGKRADLCILPELTNPHPELVIAGGQIVARHGVLSTVMPAFSWDQIFEQPVWPPITASSFVGDSSIISCRLASDVITEPLAGPPPPETVQVALIPRGGQRIARMYLAGFVTHLGGLATNITSAFDLLVMGQNPDDMALAAHRLAALGGGVAVVEGGKEVFALPLDLGGVYSSLPWQEVVRQNRAFNALMQARGFRFADPLFTLVFLTFDSLPWIRLTSRGVWDVRRRRVIDPPRPFA